jgi:hypothetical protein
MAAQLHYAGFPKSGHRFWDKNSAQTKDSKQAFVGEARNACLGHAATISPVADLQMARGAASALA